MAGDKGDFLIEDDIGQIVTNDLEIRKGARPPGCRKRTPAGWYRGPRRLVVVVFKAFVYGADPMHQATVFVVF